MFECNDLQEAFKIDQNCYEATLPDFEPIAAWVPWYVGLVKLCTVGSFLCKNRCSCQDLEPHCFPFIKRKKWDHYFNRPLTEAFHHVTHSQFLPFLSPTETCYRLEGGSQSWKLHQHSFHVSGCVYKDYDCISHAFTNGHTLGYSNSASGNDPSNPAWPAPQVEPDSVLSVKLYVRLQLSIQAHCWTQPVVLKLARDWVVELLYKHGQEESLTSRVADKIWKCTSECIIWLIM